MNRHVKRTAQAAVVAGLSLTLAAGQVCLPARAQAETGSITIHQLHNTGATYDAYQLFKADIDEKDNATHVQWASQDMSRAVLAFADDHGYKEWLSKKHPGPEQRTRAQNAAEFIASSIGDSATDLGAATTPRTTTGLSFANELAQALASDPSLEPRVVLNEQAFEGDEGFWLFVSTDETTEAHDEAGTAPIWIALGGSTKEINEKSAAPSVDKEVQEDSSGAWGKVADANTDQELSYRLTGTLPKNFGAFDHYHYRFTDTLEDGLTIPTPEGDIAKAIKVQIAGQDVSIDGKNITASYKDNVLTIDFVNLKDVCWKKYAIDKDTVITVDYQAHMNGNRVIGSKGNLNSVYLTYTDDPVSTGDGRTDDVPVRVFAYKLELLKVDEQTNEPLAGAGFTIKVAKESSDVASRGRYVQEDGSLGSSAHEFVTGSDGTFSVLGLDEGTYVISESNAPKGYEAMDADIVLTVTSALDGNGIALTSLSASLTGGDKADVNAASITGVNADGGDAGTIRVRATDDRWLAMPLTGQAGLNGIPIGGSILALVAGTGLIVRSLGHRRA